MYMNDNVRRVPLIKDQNLLAQYYSMADVFVICSKRENFPTTCVEAQCCGTPVVGFDTGGTKETSLLGAEDFVPYGDIEALRERLLHRLEDVVPDVDVNARAEYDKSVMAEKYKKLYDRNGHAERILLLDVNCKQSSTGKIVYDLYQNLRSEGRTVSICYGRGEKVDEPDILKFGYDWETYCHAGLSRLTGYNGCFSYFSTKRLIQYIEQFHPDVIHIHELHAYFVNIRPLIEFIRQKNIRVVWTFHCEYMYTGKCGLAFDCEGYLGECGNCPAVHDYPASLFFDRTNRMFLQKKTLLEPMNFTIATPSEWLARRVRRSFLKDKSIEVIHNGIETSVFYPRKDMELRRKLGIPDDHRVVLAAAPGIMREIKGGEWVLKLAESCKDLKLTFVLVGDDTLGKE